MNENSIQVRGLLNINIRQDVGSPNFELYVQKIQRFLRDSQNDLHNKFARSITTITH
jgi:hypothetical protein